jgi:hypothetical protein
LFEAMFLFSVVISSGVPFLYWMFNHNYINLLQVT